jgi:hypothetical protein
VTEALLKAFSYLNSLGVFHNNLTATNVMLSKKSEVKVHESDCMSRQGSCLQISTAMRMNPFYGSALFEFYKTQENAHSGYDAYILAHLIFLIQKDEISSKYRVSLQTGEKWDENLKSWRFKTCEP